MEAGAAFGFVWDVLVAKLESERRAFYVAKAIACAGGIAAWKALVRQRGLRRLLARESGGVTRAARSRCFVAEAVAACGRRIGESNRAQMHAFRAKGVCALDRQGARSEWKGGLCR